MQGGLLHYITLTAEIIFSLAVVPSLVLVTKYLYAHGFSHPLLLMAAHFATTTVGTFALSAAGLIDPGTMPLADAVGIGLSQAVCLAVINASLYANAVATYFALKLLAVPVLCIAAMVSDPQDLPARSLSSLGTVALLCVMIFGVGGIVAADLTATRWGVCVGLVGAMAASANQVMCNRAMRLHGISGVQLLWWQAPAGTLLLLAAGLAADDPAQAVAGPAPYGWTPHLVGALAASCGLAACANLLVYFLLTRLTRRAYQAVGYAKQVAVLAVGAAFAPVSPLLLLAAAVTLAALIAHTEAQFHAAVAAAEPPTSVVSPSAQSPASDDGGGDRNIV